MTSCESKEKNTNIIRYIDLFCGLGAFHMAFKTSEKFKCVLACDIDNDVRKIYNSNYGIKPLDDIRTINVDTIPDFDLLCAGFPCFIEGTLTLTNNGYKNIEDVEITDKLLTHNRKFQKITNLQRKIYTGYLFDIKIKYHPELITTTEEHPFYIREKKGNNFGNPIWKKANELDMNDYFGMVINNNQIIPEFTFEKSINQYKTEKHHIKFDTLDYWFVMGYLVGDSCIEEKTNPDGRYMYKIRFTINSKDENEIFERINKVIPITNKKCNQFECSNIIWYSILKQFGKYAHEKLIPEWVQDAPKEFIQEFINGYMKADGCIINNKILQVTTVSSNLAYGLQRLYLKLGHIFSINKSGCPKTTIIKGRTVRQRYTYCIKGILQRQRKMTSFIEDGYVWFAPFKIIKREITEIPVYNFEVENDNSYIVMNTIVHNCQPFSIAGNREGFKDKEKGNLFYDILKIIDAKTPKMCILENVKNLKTHDKGNTYKTIETELFKRNYIITSKIINSADYGSPQCRQRIFIIATQNKPFDIPTPIKITNPVSTIIDTTNKKDELNRTRYTLKEKSIKRLDPSKPHILYDVYPVLSAEKKKILDEAKTKLEQKGGDPSSLDKGGRQGERVYSIEAVGVTICASSGGPGAKTGLYKIGDIIRRLNVKESLGMFGFPNDYKFLDLTHEKCLFYLGNSIVVNVPLTFVPVIENWFFKK
jgi:DNA-cytosine methyltransferase